VRARALRRPGRRGIAETYEPSLAGVRQAATRKTRFGEEANLWQSFDRRGALVELLTGLGVAVVNVGCDRLERASARKVEGYRRTLVTPLGPVYTREEERERDKQQVQALARDAHR
jgi:nitric oxide synthase oxygenase domain/subunit